MKSLTRKVTKLPMNVECKSKFSGTLTTLMNAVFLILRAETCCQPNNKVDTYKQLYFDSLKSFSLLRSSLIYNEGKW